MSAADFLFTPTAQRVLGAALANPEKSFYMRELVLLADGGKGNAQRQIEKLLKAGVLVEDARAGRQRSIRANTGFFLYPELSSIARKSFGVREPLRRALEPFAEAIQEAFVFGSVAKGEDTHRSDIDLAVIGRASLLELLHAVLEAEHQIGRRVHLSLYQADEWHALVANDPVVAQIARGPKLELIKRMRDLIQEGLESGPGRAFTPKVAAELRTRALGPGIEAGTLDLNKCEVPSIAPQPRHR